MVGRDVSYFAYGSLVALSLCHDVSFHVSGQGDVEGQVGRGVGLAFYGVEGQVERGGLLGRC